MLKPMRALGLGVVAALLVGGLHEDSARAVGRITSGWPQPSMPGNVSVMSGGPVVTSVSVQMGAAAWTARGSRRWTFAHYSQWCDRFCEPPPPANDRSLPGGPFGPVDLAGTGFVSPAGKLIGRDASAVLAGGLEVTTTNGASASTVTRGRLGGSVIWTRSDPYETSSGAGSVLVSNGTSLYRGFLAGPASTPAPVIALDPMTGAERWRVDEATPLATYGSGVTVRLADGHVAGYNATGTHLFTLDNPQSAATPLWVHADVRSGRVYVEHPMASSKRWRQVDAYSTATGTLVWSVRFASVTNIGPTGTVYLARLITGGRNVLQARSPGGQTQWTFATPTRVRGAAALADGTVCLTTDPIFPGRSGLAMRINPTVGPVTVTRNVIRITARTINASTRSTAVARLIRREFDPSFGFRMRFDMRRAQTLWARAVNASASGAVEIPWARLTVPAGRSYARAVLPPGTWEIQIRRAGSTRIIKRTTITAVAT